MGIAYPLIFLGLAILGYASISPLRWRYRGNRVYMSDKIGKKGLDRLRESNAAAADSRRLEQDDPS
jgi:hypothetical protein